MTWLDRILGRFTRPRPPAAPSPPEAAVPTAPRRPKAPRREWPAEFGEPHLHADGWLWTMKPLADIAVQGIPCQKGQHVSFHANGRVASATLARATTLDGEALPAGTPVVFDTDGRLEAWSLKLASDRELMIRAARAEALACPLRVPAGSTITVEHRQLRSVVLSAPAAVDGQDLPAWTEVIFGDSGALSHVTPREELRLRGIPCAAHETVVFELGLLHELTPAADVVVDGVPCAAGEVLRFDEDGRLRRLYTSEDAIIREVPCRDHTRVYLHANGAVAEATLARATGFGPVTVAEDQDVLLSEEGRLLMGTPAEPCVVGGVPVAAGAKLMLHDDGTPLSVVLGDAHDACGARWPAGTSLTWSRPGHGVSSIVTVEDAQAWGQRFAGPHVFYLDDDGGLRRALPCVRGNASTRGVLLRADAVVDGIRCRARTAVELHPDGRVSSLVLAGDQQVGGLLCKDNTEVIWNEDGSRQVTLAADATIGGVPCRAGRELGCTVNDVARYAEYVRLHPNGVVSWAKAARDAEVDGVPVKAGQTVCLHEDGRFHLGTTSGRFAHPGGWTAAAGTLLSLFPDGSPSLVTLAEPFTFAGTRCEAGSAVRFSAPGVVAASTATQVAIDCVVC
jgi:hypothetical protein